MPLSARIGCLDIDLGAPLLLRIGEAGLEEDVRQEGIVDLHQKSGSDDRLVLVAERCGDGVEILFLALVVLVPADARSGGRGYEDMLVRHAGGLGRRLEVGDVLLHRRLADIFYRPDANHRRQGRDRAAHHRLLEYCS